MSTSGLERQSDSNGDQHHVWKGDRSLYLKITAIIVGNGGGDVDDGQQLTGHHQTCPPRWKSRSWLARRFGCLCKHAFSILLSNEEGVSSYIFWRPCVVVVNMDGKSSEAADAVKREVKLVEKVL